MSGRYSDNHVTEQRGFQSDICYFKFNLADSTHCTVLSWTCEEKKENGNYFFFFILWEAETISKDNMSPSSLFPSTNGNTSPSVRVPRHLENCFLSCLHVLFLFFFFPLLASPFYFLDLFVRFLYAFSLQVNTWIYFEISFVSTNVYKCLTYFSLSYIL